MPFDEHFDRTFSNPWTITYKHASREVQIHHDKLTMMKDEAYEHAQKIDTIGYLRPRR
jgi:hypothetical protein